MAMDPSIPIDLILKALKELKNDQGEPQFTDGSFFAEFIKIIVTQIITEIVTNAEVNGGSVSVPGGPVVKAKVS